MVHMYTYLLHKYVYIYTYSIYISNIDIHIICVYICIYTNIPQSVGLSKPFPAEAFGMARGNQRFDAVRGGHLCREGVQQVAWQCQAWDDGTLW